MQKPHKKIKPNFLSQNLRTISCRASSVISNGTEESEAGEYPIPENRDFIGKRKRAREKEAEKREAEHKKVIKKNSQLTQEKEKWKEKFDKLMKKYEKL